MQCSVSRVGLKAPWMFGHPPGSHREVSALMPELNRICKEAGRPEGRATLGSNPCGKLGAGAGTGEIPSFASVSGERSRIRCLSQMLCHDRDQLRFWCAGIVPLVRLGKGVVVTTN